MVNYRFLTLAALALPFAAAAPTVEALEVRQTEIFSFEKWVNSIIENPETALTPEQALEAWNISTKNGTISSSSSLSKRDDVSCRTAVGQTPVEDAVIVINKLAALGSQACVSYTTTFFMTYGQAQCVGVVSSPPYPVTTTCQKVAQSAGLIMDKCTSKGVTGGQASNVANPRMRVHLGYPS